MTAKKKVKTPENTEEVNEEVTDIPTEMEAPADSFILWFRVKEGDIYRMVYRPFKSETSANNHNLYVLGHTDTVVLPSGQSPNESE